MMLDHADMDGNLHKLVEVRALLSLQTMQGSTHLVGVDMCRKFRRVCEL